MRKKTQKVQVKLNPKELRVLLEGMMWFRNQVIRAGGPTEDIDDIQSDTGSQGTVDLMGDHSKSKKT